MALGVSASWIHMGVRMGASLLAMPLFYHYLPPELLGVWLLFASLGAVFSVSDLGLAQVTARELAFRSGGAGRAGAQDLLTTVSRAYLGIAGLVLLLAGLGGWLYLGSLELKPEFLDQARHAWLVYALGMAFILGGSTPNYALQGLGDLGLEALAQAGLLLLGLAAQFALLRAGGSLLGLACVFLAQAAGLRALLWILLRRRHTWLFEGKGRFRPELLKGLLGQSSGLFISSLCALFIYQINPVLIVAMLGAAALPDYSALLALAGMGLQLAAALPQALMPFAAARKAEGDMEGVRRLHAMALKLGLGIQLAYSAVLLAWAPSIIGLWIGPEHFAGYAILLPLAAFHLLEHHHVANATFSFSAGRWPFAPWSFAGGLLNACFVWAGLKWMGLPGAALGSLLAQLLTNNWYVPYYTLRLLELPLRRYARQVLAPLALVALALLFAAASLRQVLPLLPGAAACAAVAAALGWRWLLSGSERETLMARLRGLRA